MNSRKGGNAELGKTDEEENGTGRDKRRRGRGRHERREGWKEGWRETEGQKASGEAGEQRDREMGRGRVGGEED